MAPRPRRDPPVAGAARIIDASEVICSSPRKMGGSCAEEAGRERFETLTIALAELAGRKLVKSLERPGA